jgi:hypothetical protein
MTWKAGINWVLGTFGLLCVLHVAPPLASRGVVESSTFQLVVAVAGLYFTIGAWRRDFLGFVGVLAICATAVAYDVFLLAAMGIQDPIRVMNALLYGTVGAALYTARREFPRRRPAGG